jgi:predicted nucleic acid-binding protein
VIVLDTNVVSELMRRTPDPKVVAWVDSQPPESLWTTSITVFEIRFGLALLVPSRRRRQLEDAFALALEDDLEGRILSFDESAAQAAGALAARRRRAGRTVEFRDAMIAGIVVARKASLATGNGRHFAGLDLTIIDPWSA